MGVSHITSTLFVMNIDSEQSCFEYPGRYSAGYKGEFGFPKASAQMLFFKSRPNPD